MNPSTTRHIWSRFSCSLVTSRKARGPRSGSPFAGRSRTERSRAAIPGERGQQATQAHRRLAAIKGCLRATNWHWRRRVGEGEIDRRKRKGRGPDESLRKRGVVCQRIDCGWGWSYIRVLLHPGQRVGYTWWPGRRMPVDKVWAKGRIAWQSKCSKLKKVISLSVSQFHFFCSLF